MQEVQYVPGTEWLNALAAGTVFVFRVMWEADGRAWKERMAPLAADERARAERYRYEGDAARFVQSRRAAREALGSAVGCPAAAVEIEYGACGKPRLSERQARALGTREPLTFNVSHAGGMCLIALGAYELLGIDVEERLDADDLPDLADRFFAPKEAARICALPDGERIEAFYACWTRKEALIKALGHGMGQYGIDTYEVNHTGEACDCLLEMPGGSEEALRWTIADLSLGGSAYAAALAVRGAPAEIRVTDWKARRQGF